GSVSATWRSWLRWSCGQREAHWLIRVATTATTPQRIATRRPDIRRRVVVTNGELTASTTLPRRCWPPGTPPSPGTSGPLLWGHGDAPDGHAQHRLRRLLHGHRHGLGWARPDGGLPVRLLRQGHQLRPHR